MFRIKTILLIACFSLLITLPATAKTVIFVGDSLTAGLGVEKENAYPSIISNKLKTDGHTVKIINASISGSTSASAVSRMKWVHKMKPDVIFLALGANDGLRGLSTNEMEKNLSRAIQIAISEQTKVILAGMEIPPNYGKTYTDNFRKVFKSLAKQYHITFIPFLLQNVGGYPELNQADGIHPNRKGHQIMAENIYPYILEAIQ